VTTTVITTVATTTVAAKCLPPPSWWSTGSLKPYHINVAPYHTVKTLFFPLLPSNGSSGHNSSGSTYHHHHLLGKETCVSCAVTVHQQRSSSWSYCCRSGDQQDQPKTAVKGNTDGTTTVTTVTSTTVATTITTCSQVPSTAVLTGNLRVVYVPQTPPVSLARNTAFRACCSDCSFLPHPCSKRSKRSQQQQQQQQ